MKSIKEIFILIKENKNLMGYCPPSVGATIAGLCDIASFLYYRKGELTQEEFDKFSDFMKDNMPSYLKGEDNEYTYWWSKSDPERWEWLDTQIEFLP